MSAPAPRILLIRTSALGDVVHCLPVLTALRRHLPNARLGWVVEEAMAPVLEGHPDLDELIPVRLRLWRKRPFARQTLREVRQLLAAMDRFAATITLDLMGNHKAGILAALSHAERRIGLARPFRREPSSAVWINETVRAMGNHAVERALSVLSALSVPASPVDFGSDKLFSQPTPETEMGVRPFALIHVGAGWGNKRYPAERWGRVAAQLAEQTGLVTRISGGPGEETLVQHAIESSRGTAEALRAPTLARLAIALRQAEIVLAGDTGPLHLAHALGSRTLCLMGPTSPEQHGPYAAPENALWRTLPCSFCYRRFDETKACLLEITPQRIVDHAVKLLENQN